MPWNQLTGSELQAVRKLLMLDVSDAARLIGNVSARTWQYWEAGRTKVPDDVDMEMYALAQLRAKLIEEMLQSIEDSEQENVCLPYYHTFEAWSQVYPDKNEVQWRLHQAAVAQVFSEGGNIELI